MFNKAFPLCKVGFYSSLKSNKRFISGATIGTVWSMKFCLSVMYLWIRKFILDELLEQMNLARGTMSFVSNYIVLRVLKINKNDKEITNSWTKNKYLH